MLENVKTQEYSELKANLRNTSLYPLVHILLGKNSADWRQGPDH